MNIANVTPLTGKFSNRRKPVYTRNEEAYRFYKKTIRKSKSNHKITREREWQKINTEIWKTALELLINNAGGLYIENLGYFGFMMDPEQKIDIIMYKGRPTRYLNYHTDFHRYFPMFFPMSKPLRPFYMDRVFTKNARQKFVKQLRSGFRYKLFYTTVKLMSKNKHKSRKNEPRAFVFGNRNRLK